MRSPLGTALDALTLALLGIWLGALLPHGADPRRAAILVALLGAALGVRGSRVLSAARALARALGTPRGAGRALAAWLVLTGALGALQALALRVPLWDVGIFHQIIWSLSQGHGFVSTVSGAGNFLADHFSPALALLTPVFQLTRSSPLTLPVAEPMLLASGGLAWLWLARRLSGTGMSALPAATLVFFLFFDSLWGNLRWGFHETSLSFAFLSWAVALLLAEPSRKRPAIAALLLATALTKETGLLSAAMGFAALARLDREGSRSSRALWLGISVALMGAFVAYQGLPHPAGKNYFIRYYSYFGPTLGEFARGLALRPWEAVRAVGPLELLRYGKTLLLPWLALPLIGLWTLRGRDRERFASVLLIALPSAASAALATYAPLRDPGFHYVLEIWPVFAGLTLLALARLGRPQVTWAWALLALLSWDHDPVAQLREYASGARARTPFRSVLAEIPGQDRVQADELAGPWVASRLEITRRPDPLLSGMQPDWLVLHQAAPAAPRGYEPFAHDAEWSLWRRAGRP